MVKITRLKDRLYMPPLQKYEVYGKFPWKLIIQILLITFTTCQTLLIVNQSTMYSYNQYTLWNKLFLNHDVQGSDTTITNSFNIFEISKLKSYIQTTVDRYFDINSHTIDNYYYDYESDGTKKPVKLLVEYFDNENAFDLDLKIEYSLYQNNLGPISDPDLQSYLNQAKHFEIRFTLIHRVDTHANLASTCYEWEIVQKYDYSTHGTITVELLPNRKTCEKSQRNLLYRQCYEELSMNKYLCAYISSNFTCYCWQIYWKKIRACWRINGDGWWCKSRMREFRNIWKA